MRISTQTPSLDTARHSSQHDNAYKPAQVPNIRVSFEPVTRQDQTLSGMRNYMLRQLGVGGAVNALV